MQPGMKKKVELLDWSNQLLARKDNLLWEALLCEELDEAALGVVKLYEKLVDSVSSGICRLSEEEALKLNYAEKRLEILLDYAKLVGYLANLEDTNVMHYAKSELETVELTKRTLEEACK